MEEKEKKKEVGEKGWGQGLISEKERRLQSPGEHVSRPSGSHDGCSGAAAQAVWGPG